MPQRSMTRRVTRHTGCGTASGLQTGVTGCIWQTGGYSLLTGFKVFQGMTRTHYLTMGFMLLLNFELVCQYCSTELSNDAQKTSTLSKRNDNKHIFLRQCNAGVCAIKHITLGSCQTVNVHNDTHLPNKYIMPGFILLAAKENPSKFYPQLRTTGSTSSSNYERA